MTTPLRKKRIMRSFSLSEISSVDVPAQRGALAGIMKRHAGKLTDAELDHLTAMTVASKRIGEITETIATKRDEPQEKTMGFLQRVNEIQAVRKDARTGKAMSRQDAMAAARKEYPEEYAAYQEQGDEMSKADAKPTRYRKSAEVISFEKRVAEIYGTRKNARTGKPVTRAEAMALARREHPTEFEAYQAVPQNEPVE